MPFSDLRLDARLDGLRRWVRPGARAIDVGADHGLLALALAREGRVEKIVATEREEGRAAALRRNARACGASDRFEIRIGDGLSVLRSPDRIDTAILAGMGPHAIARALAARPADVPAPRRLLLQPQGDAARTRRDVMRRGYRLEREAWVVVSGRGYPLIDAALGDPVEERHPRLDADALAAVGPRLVERPSAALVEHWRGEIRRAERDVARAGSRPDATEPRRRLERARTILEALVAAGTGRDGLV